MPPRNGVPSTGGFAPAAGAGRVASTRTLPSWPIWAIWRASAKVTAADPSGSSAMFSGCCLFARSRCANTRGADSAEPGAADVAGGAGARGRGGGGPPAHPAASPARAAATRAGLIGMASSVTSFCLSFQTEPEASQSVREKSNSRGKIVRMTEGQWLDEEEMRAWRGYVEVSALLSYFLDRQLQADVGMPHAHYAALVRLTEAPDRCLRMSELAEQLRITRSRLSHTVAKLEKAGWVERRGDPSDGRGQLAVLTDEG